MTRCPLAAPHRPHHYVRADGTMADCAGVATVAPNGCDDCSVEPGEPHRYTACPGADIHHPKGPLTAQPAAQQPPSPGEARLRAEIAHFRGEWTIEGDSTWLWLTRILDGEQGCVMHDAEAARDARVRAATAREVAEDIAAAIEAHHPADELTAIQSARIARHHATQYDAPSVRPDTDRTPDVGTPDHPEPEEAPLSEPEKIENWREAYNLKVQDLAAETRRTSILIQALHDAGHRGEDMPPHRWCGRCRALLEIGATPPPYGASAGESVPSLPEETPS